MSTFCQTLISALWHEHHTRVIDERSDYESLRTAVYELRRMTGLSLEQLAGRLGMFPHQLRLIEKRGSPIEIADVERMKLIAWQFSLFKLWQYFDKEILALRDRLKPNRRRKLNAS